MGHPAASKQRIRSGDGGYSGRLQTATRRRVSAGAAKFDVLALTVDTITGGNRERDLRTGFTSPPRLTLKSFLSFAMHPRWAANYFMHEKFELPQLKDYVKEGSSISVSVGDYFSTML